MFDLSRRKFLSALGVASVPATATKALATAPAVMGETPEILALGRRLAALESQLEAAEKARDEAVAQFEANKPTPPPDLICHRFIDHRPNPDSHLAEYVSDPVAERRTDIRLYHSYYLMEELKGWPEDASEPRAEWLRRLLAMAESYESAFEAAEQEFSSRTETFYSIRSALHDVAGKLSRIDAKTMVGVTIKARAICALVRVAGDSYTKRSVAMVVGPGLAADIVRLGASQP